MKQIKRGVFFLTICVQAVLWSTYPIYTYAQPGIKGNPELTVQRLCGQCHALKVAGDCLAGNCEGPNRVIQVIQPPPWDFVLDNMLNKGATISKKEQQEILAFLKKNYPAKRYPLSWKKIGALTHTDGWNITSLRAYKGMLYAGFEGNGKIFRSGDGIRWVEVASTNSEAVYGITPFQGLLYAGIAEPTPQIWHSKNGLQWQPGATLPVEDAGVYSTGVFKDQLYVGTGRSWIYRSSDGQKWEKVAALKGDVPAIFWNWVRFLIPFKGYLYAGIEQGPLYRSADGAAWTEIKSEVGGGNGVRGAAVFKNALYVGATSGGDIWKTEDGQTWQHVLKAPNDSPGYVASMTVAGKYLFATINGYIYRSPDGLAWEEVAYFGFRSMEDMTFWRNMLYVGVAVSPDAYIYRAYPSNK